MKCQHGCIYCVSQSLVIDECGLFFCLTVVRKGGGVQKVKVITVQIDSHVTMQTRFTCATQVSPGSVLVQFPRHG